MAVADQDKSEITLTIHGLSIDDGRVRAHVFLSKFQRLLDALDLADKHLNKTKLHD